jgi:hypothetical protein
MKLVLKGSSLRWGAFRPRRLPEVNHHIMGSPEEAMLE